MSTMDGDQVEGVVDALQGIDRTERRMVANPGFAAEVADEVIRRLRLEVGALKAEFRARLEAAGGAKEAI